MKTFIHKLIHKLIDKLSSQTQDAGFVNTLIILPNRRAHRKLVNELAALNAGKTFFSPTVFPMDEFVSYLSPLRTIDTSVQMLRLFQVVRDIENKYCTMKGFQTWARPFLRDISDMDMQLQDVAYCLREHAKAAHFETTFGKDETSENEQQKMFFNERLATIYADFKSLLKNRSEAYTGLLYRDCAENIADYAQKIDYKRIVFAGFYALSPSELEIIKYFKENYPTEIYFDTDNFYCHLDDESDEEVRRQTSFFIRRNCERLGIDIKKMDFISRDYEEIRKKVDVVSTAKRMRQVFCAIEEIERIRDRKLAANGSSGDVVDMSDTAVVLADESLLVPFLSAYNVENVDINVTMGIPLSSTPIFSVIQNLINVYEMAIVLTEDDDPELVFNGADVRSLYENHLLKNDFPITKFFFPPIISYSKLPYKEFFLSCQKVDVGGNLNRIIINLCKILLTCDIEDNDKLLCNSVVEKLETLQAELENSFLQTDIVDFSFTKMLVMNYLNKIALTIKGDPNKSLQVMGLLETRMLDFRNVIMLSVNEGVLPSGLKFDSLLPFDFKYKLDGKDAISNYLYQDQVFAYHFFRLLQRAENVMLIYNNISENSLAECSRFVRQLEYEVRTQNLQENIEIRHIYKDFSLKLPKSGQFVVDKTDEIIDILHNLSYSASSLKSYIACPMRFFFQQVAKINKNEALGDELEPYEVGTVIHGVFQKVFDEIKTESDETRYGAIFDKYLNEVDKEIKEQILKLENRENLSESTFEQGSWLVNILVLRETIKNYLQKAKKEFESARITIVGNELYAETVLQIPDFQDENNYFDVKIKGVFDRVQERAGTVEILDYKTGTVDSKNLKVGNSRTAEEEKEELFRNKVFKDPSFEKLFQLIFYAFLYKSVTKSAENKQIRGGIVSTRAVNRNSNDYIRYGNVFDEDNLDTCISQFSEELETLFNEIFDKKSPFVQTDNAKNCEYCDYREICSKASAEGQ